MRTIFSLFLVLSLTGFSQQKKILIVGSNIDLVNEKVNGTYLMEIAIPFNYFKQQGFEIDVVSPNGGKVAIYHKGDTVAILKRILKDKLFIQKTTMSLSPAKVKPEDYAAIIFPGGYGHFWDVYISDPIAVLAAKIYEAGGVIGSLGHGTADLLNIKLKNGSYFVKGKTLTCFPTWCEQEFMTEADYGKLLPVDMQKELAARGAILKVCTKENRKDAIDMNITDADNRLVTASFADGGVFVASEVQKLIMKR